MTAMFATMIVLAGLGFAQDGRLLDAEFVADIAPLTSVAAPRCEDGVALLEPGATTLSAAGPFVGDLAVDLRFAAVYDGDLSIRFPGAPDFEARIANDGCHLRFGERRIAFPVATSAAAYSLRVRSQAVELSAGQSPIAFAEFDVPLAGGAITIELVTRTSAKLESVAISRLPFADRDEVLGLDAERARRLATLPLEKFRLVDPVVSRLDPIFRIVVEGEAEEIVAKGRGLRPSEDDIPLLEQALALARIRPLLRFDLFEGEAEVDDPPLARRDDGAYVITKPPGAIRVRSYCGVVGAWPVLVVVDVTRNRVLARINPGGPSTGDAWATIPRKCDRLRIALVVPDGPTIEHFVDFVRP